MSEILIRTVQPADLEAVTALEARCFPPLEAATRESFHDRIATFPERFFVAEHHGQIIGLVNGCVSNSPVITDEMYESDAHCPGGLHQMVFGLAVDPDYRGQGIASRLLQTLIDLARRETRQSVALTCKAEKIPFYQRFGFTDLGVSESCHGGVVWHDMTLQL